MIFLPHTNTVILLEPYCGTITEPGSPVVVYCRAKVEFNSINIVRHGNHSTTFETDKYVDRKHGHVRPALSNIPVPCSTGKDALWLVARWWYPWSSLMQATRLSSRLFCVSISIQNLVLIAVDRSGAVLNPLPCPLVTL